MAEKTILSTIDTNIPTCDFEAWGKYPRLREIYDIQNLFELQKQPTYTIKEHDDCFVVPSYPFYHNEVVIRPDVSEYHIRYIPGHFFTEKITDPNNVIHIDTVICKGTIQWTKQYRYKNLESGLPKIEFINSEISGNVMLKINALITMFLHKFNGMVEIEIVDNLIIAIHLRPNPKTINLYPGEFISQINRLYSKKTFNVPKV